MVRILEIAGVKVDYNGQQTCCGQVAFNAGYWDEAKCVAEKFIRDFDSYKYVVGPSASCIGMIRNYYPQMFFNSSLHIENRNLSQKIFELSDFLVRILKKEDFGGEFRARVTLHDSCAALREYGLKDQPRRLLAAIRGLELVEMAEPETCCGFGGTFSVKHEAISTAMAQQKVHHALQTRAEYIVSTETSCLMHMQSYIARHGLSIQTIHLADLLAQSLDHQP